MSQKKEAKPDKDPPPDDVAKPAPPATNAKPDKDPPPDDVAKPAPPATDAKPDKDPPPDDVAKPAQPATNAKPDKERAVAIRRVWEGFARNVPYAAQSSGRHAPDDAAIEAAPDHGVPDGRYRVVGADWVLVFAGGKFVAADKAGADIDPATYQEVASL